MILRSCQLITRFLPMKNFWFYDIIETHKNTISVYPQMESHLHLCNLNQCHSGQQYVAHTVVTSHWQVLQLAVLCCMTDGFAMSCWSALMLHNAVVKKSKYFWRRDSSFTKQRKESPSNEIMVKSVHLTDHCTIKLMKRSVRLHESNPWPRTFQTPPLLLNLKSLLIRMRWTRFATYVLPVFLNTSQHRTELQYCTRLERISVAITWGNGRSTCKNLIGSKQNIVVIYAWVISRLRSQIFP